MKNMKSKLRIQEMFINYASIKINLIKIFKK